MIDSLRLINFKAFEDQLLQFKPLTLLSGLNSTGKSSVLQSLLLLRQSYYAQAYLDLFNYLMSYSDFDLKLKGLLVDIGTARDAFCERAKSNNIEFEIVWKGGAKNIWKFKYDLQKQNENIMKNMIETPGGIFIPSDKGNSNLFSLEKFQYLEAERIGPRPYNDLQDFDKRLSGKLGSKGEYTVDFLATWVNREDQNINDPKLIHPEAKSLNLIDQVEAWMREISPGIRLETQANPEMGIVNIQYFYGDSNRYRATNVGFGITYTLPIIVAILSSSPGSLILIENPEAHLHPRGQAKMGELLALAASCGIQVVIETHSDHVLNGIRLAVHGGKIKPEDVQLHYFQRQEKQGQAVTKVISPRIYRDGTIDRWPDGFFDEWEISLDALLEPVQGD